MYKNRVIIATITVDKFLKYQDPKWPSLGESCNGSGKVRWEGLRSRTCAEDCRGVPKCRQGPRRGVQW